MNNISISDKNKFEATFNYHYPIEICTCPAIFRKVFNLTELDTILLNILTTYRETGISYEGFGLLLGFAVKQDWQNGFYQDSAEIEIFNHILDELYNFNLINKGDNWKEDSWICLSEDGLTALIKNTKYKYFNQDIICYQDQIPFKTHTDFSFKDEFGLTIVVVLKKEIKLSKWCEERNDVKNNNSYWFERVSTQYFYDKEIEILRVFEPIHSDLKKIETEYLLIESSDYQYQCRINIKTEFSEVLNQVINHAENVDFKNILISEYRFEKIWNDPEALFTIIEIKEFAYKWDWNLLIQDHRLEWSIEILEFISKNQSNGLWIKISQLIPTDLLENSLALFAGNWEWSIITERVSQNFIDNHFVDFIDYWHKPTLLTKDIEFVKKLILRGVEYEMDWDLSEITNHLSDDFLLETFNSSNRYDYEILSNNNKDWILRLIKQELNKLSEKQIPTSLLHFNWIWITETWSLDFIIENIDSLQSLVEWKVLLYRVINSSDYKWLLYDEGFKILLAENSYRTSGFSDEKISWTEDLIIRLDELELLIWSSTFNRKGIDTNESITWIIPLFLKFQHRFTSKMGQIYISSYIDSFDFLKTFPDFTWDWYAISNNQKLIWTPDALFEFKDKIFWSIISGKVSEPFLDHYFEKFKEYWDTEVLSSKVSFQFISKYLEIINWNFVILTKRDNYTITKLIIENRINITKWDCKWICENYEVEHLKKIVPFLAIANSSEDEINIWSSLTRRFDWEYISSVYYDKWDWDYLTNEITIEQLLLLKERPISNHYNWDILTKRLLIDNLYEDIIIEGEERLNWQFLIDKHYDLEYLLTNKIQTARWINQINDEEKQKSLKSLFTKRLNLEQKRALMDEDESLQILDWTQLSLLQSLPWSSHLIDTFKEKWDWKNGLSRNSKINWDWHYLERYNEDWDWVYISEFSHFLKLDKNEINDKKANAKVLKTIKKFEKNIDFIRLSSRSNIHFTDDIIKSFLTNWDFSALSFNKSLRISPNFLIETQEQNWDWQALSSSKFLQLDNECILSLKDKNWDWFELTISHKFDFNYDLINQTIDKSWYWGKIGNTLNGDKDFYPIIELIKDKGLNWEIISDKKFIDFSKYLEPLAKYWNFKVLSQNSAFQTNPQQVEKFSEHWDYKSLTHLRWNDNQGKMTYISKYPEKDWDWKFLLNDHEHPKSIEWMSLVANYLDWSRGTEIFMKLDDKEIESGLETLKWYLNWNAIAENYDFTKKHKSKIDSIYQKEPSLIFLNRLEKQDSEWKGYIYHYAHLENVVKILNSGEILSRNLAMHQDQAAQQIVNRRKDAHEYARFYFRPKTPYQYFTEGLGIPFGQEIYDEYAQKGVEYPKCPVPFLIKISLKEALSNPPEELRITNGNFHADLTQAFLLKDAVEVFDYSNVYSTFPYWRKFIGLSPNMGFNKDNFRQAIKTYKIGSQQELVVKDCLKIDNFQCLEVICIDEIHKEVLINLLSQNHKWQNKIKINSQYYILENSFINHVFEEDELYVWRDKQEVKRRDSDGNKYSEFYDAKGKICLEANIVELIDGDIIKQTPMMVESYTNVKVRLKNNSYKIYFVDDKTKWLIYSC